MSPSVPMLIRATLTPRGSQVPQLSLHSQIGDLTVSEEGGQIVSLDWGWSSYQEASPLVEKAVTQLHQYFDGQGTCFDLPLMPMGSDHDQKVWDAIAAIPYGTTLSYGDIARQTGSSPQAVGRAAGANPIPIIVPCHRVMAADGTLHGYSGEGGVETKRALLILEGALPPPLI